MSIYSEQIQQLTDQLVAEVTTLYTVVTSNLDPGPPDWQAITDATNTAQTTANSLDYAVKTADVPATDTMILAETTQILQQFVDLQAAISATDTDATANLTDQVVLTTSNLNRCVTRMSESQTPTYASPDVTPLPPWFSIPMAPPTPGS